MENKQNQPKNKFQIDDPYAPDNTISVKTEKIKRVINVKERNFIRKTYFLDNGNKHIVEIEKLQKIF